VRRRFARVNPIGYFRRPNTTSDCPSTKICRHTETSAFCSVILVLDRAACRVPAAASPASCRPVWPADCSRPRIASPRIPFGRSNHPVWPPETRRIIVPGVTGSAAAHRCGMPSRLDSPLASTMRDGVIFSVAISSLPQRVSPRIRLSFLVDVMWPTMGEEDAFLGRPLWAHVVNLIEEIVQTLSR
jgi:hypothetical protein